MPMEHIPSEVFATVCVRNVPDVSARELAEFLEAQCPWLKVRQCDRPELATGGTYFVELFEERQAVRLCELAGGGGDDEDVAAAPPGRSPLAPFKGRRLVVDWPRGSEPWRARAWSRRQQQQQQQLYQRGDRHPQQPAPLPRQPALVGWLELVPVVALLLALGTLGATLYLAKQEGRVAPGQFLVPISLWAAEGGWASHVYALGLSLVGALLLLTATLLWPVLHWLGRLAPSHTGYCRTAALAGFVAPVAMMVQAAVPLPSAFAEAALAGRAPAPSTQAAVHQGAAGLFFLAGAVHAYAVCQLWDYLTGPDTPAAVRAVFPASRLSYHQKHAAMLCQALVPVANILHPVAWSYLAWPMTLHHRMAMAAASQFLVVGGLLFFFFSYARDLIYCRLHVVLIGQEQFRAPAKQETKKQTR